jgi:hypothetical protein
MNISDKVIDIIKGMEGIGGIPTDEEFMNELDSRIDHLRVKSNSVLGDVIILPIDHVEIQKMAKEYANGSGDGFRRLDFMNGALSLKQKVEGTEGEL